MDQGSTAPRASRLTWLNYLHTDALNRAWRTALQGIVAAALFAAGDVVREALVSDKVTDWHDVGVSALHAAYVAALMVVLSYLHRVLGDRSSVPSATPPAPPTGSPPDSLPVIDTRPTL